MNANKTIYLAVDGAVYEAVRDVVGRAVDGVSLWAVYGAVWQAVWRAVSGAVSGAVPWTVPKDMYRNPPHPFLSEFLAAAGAEAP